MHEYGKGTLAEQFYIHSFSCTFDFIHIAFEKKKVHLYLYKKQTTARKIDVYKKINLFFWHIIYIPQECAFGVVPKGL